MVTFKKSDIKDLTNVLQELCDNPNKVNNYKKSAQDFILKKYNWGEVVDYTLKLYNKKRWNKCLKKII